MDRIHILNNRLSNAYKLLWFNTAYDIWNALSRTGPIF